MTKNLRKQPAPFSVTDPKKVLNLCSNKLKPLLGNYELGYKEIPTDPNCHIFALIIKNSSSASTPDDRGNRHNIIPLPLTKSGNYWINISLTFLSNQSKQKIKPESFQFSGVSIRIFKGALTSADKEPVLRAEWDALKDDNNHAQPHWHVYKSFQTADSNTSDFTSSLTLSNEVKDFGEIIEQLNLGEAQKEIFENPEETNLENTQEKSTDNSWDYSTKFHFAMASQWHNKENHRVVLDKEALLYEWLGRCVQYIIEQLNYVSGSR